MILDLQRQGLKVATIARQLGIDRKTVRKYLAKGLDVPAYGLRQPRTRLTDGHVAYLKSRLEAYPGLTAQRLMREITERGYKGSYSTLRDVVRELRPPGGGRGCSAHSTRVGLTQDMFVSGEDLAGIMDAGRWKSPRMPLSYNRNLAAEQGAVGRLMAKIG